MRRAHLVVFILAVPLQYVFNLVIYILYSLDVKYRHIEIRWVLHVQCTCFRDKNLFYFSIFNTISRINILKTIILLKWNLLPLKSTACNKIYASTKSLHLWYIMYWNMCRPLYDVWCMTSVFRENPLSTLEAESKWQLPLLPQLPFFLERPPPPPCRWIWWQLPLLPQLPSIF